jgi:hypothetical protein
MNALRGRTSEESDMRWTVVAAAAVVTVGIAGGVGVPAGSAQAAGCLKGAVVGGVAGHFVHHHGLIGAGVGCAIGHHEAAKRAREQAYERDNNRY